MQIVSKTIQITISNSIGTLIIIITETNHYLSHIMKV